MLHFVRGGLRLQGCGGSQACVGERYELWIPGGRHPTRLVKSGAGGGYEGGSKERFSECRERTNAHQFFRILETR